MTQDHAPLQPGPAFLLPLGAFTAAALWGSAYPVIKYAFTLLPDQGMAMRVAFAGVRFTLAGVILLLFLKNRRSQMNASNKGLLLGVAILQISLHYFLFYWGLSLNSGVVSAVLGATGSFWWILLAPVFHGTPYPRKPQVALLALGFSGVCLAVAHGGSVGTFSAFGCGLLVASTLCATLAHLAVRPLTETTGSRFITATALSLGGLVLLVFGAPALPQFIAAATPMLWGITLYLGLVSALAFSLWYTLIGRYDVNTLSGYRYLIPICGVAESALFIPGESLTLGITVGAAIVCACIWGLSRV